MLYLSYQDGTIAVAVLIMTENMEILRLCRPKGGRPIPMAGRRQAALVQSQDHLSLRILCAPTDSSCVEHERDVPR
jgi:hypothetical protein